MGRLNLGSASMIRVDTLGQIRDSIPEPLWNDPGPVDPRTVWMTMRSDGGIVLTRTDKVGFMFLSALGAAPRIVELEAVAPLHNPEEREELQRAEDWETPVSQRKRVPEAKPFLRGTQVDLDGRIWLRRSAEGQRTPSRVLYWAMPGGKVSVSWADPPRFAGFLADGTYLGEVRFPVEARVVFHKEYAWAVVPGPDDEPILIKYRLHS
jgi:hypothetical protein